MFISVMQSVNGAQFLNATSLSLLSGFPGGGGGTGMIVIVPLTSIYALL